MRTAPRGVLPYYLLLECAAVVLPFVLPGRAWDANSLMWFGLLLVIAGVQAEFSAGVERIRRFKAGTRPHIHVSSVWMFAAVLTLPPLLASGLAALVYAHLWVRVWRFVPGVRLYRAVCSAATAVLGALCSGIALVPFGLHLQPPGLPAIIVGGLVFPVVNTVLVVIGFKLHDPRAGCRTLVGSWAENALDIVTFCLGGITAVLLVTHPGLAVLVLLPVVLLPRGELGRELEMTVARDDKTGLLTIAEWRKGAELELAKPGTVFALLMVDIDFFKRINDSYGHLSGDVVLRAVADVVQREVRAYDSVGRFGGEEFVVLLPGIGEDHSAAVAERIRDAVTKLAITATDDVIIKNVSVSIGIAVYPAAGSTLEEVLATADKALYRAKHLGRNRVCAMA